MHPELSKAEKRRLCSILECEKLSPKVRAHAVKNEFLPLRTVVQLLYYEQEKDSKATISPKLRRPHELLLGAKKRPATIDSHSKTILGLDKEAFKRQEVTRRISLVETKEKGQHKTKRLDDKLALDLEKKMVIREGTEEIGSEKLRGAKEESMLGSKLDLDPKKMTRRTRSNKSEHGHEKRR